MHKGIAARHVVTAGLKSSPLRPAVRADVANSPRRLEGRLSAVKAYRHVAAPPVVAFSDAQVREIPRGTIATCVSDGADCGCLPWRFWSFPPELWQPVFMSSSPPYKTRPVQAMEIRVVERDARRFLQQYVPPSGGASQWSWVDVCELAPLPSNVRQLKRVE